MPRVSDPEVLEMFPTLREAFEKGEQQGLQKGMQKVLSGLFAERSGRAPTRDEREALVKRVDELGAEEALRALLRLHGDALSAWLLGSDASYERSG
jgi:hypothetical protein